MRMIKGGTQRPARRKPLIPADVHLRRIVMRKTKIICTIGPASSNEEVLTQMALAGMNAARLNFSHGSYESHLETINLIKKVREKLGLHIAIILDTKGPEYRVGTFEGGAAELKDGDVFVFTTRAVPGNSRQVSVSYNRLNEDLEAGDRVMVNDGLVELEVVDIKDTDIICRVLKGGVVSDRKGMNFPGKVLKQPFLSEQDKSDILFGLENGIDFIAASFVSNKEDVQAIRQLLDENGADNIEIIAKIENSSGIENIKEICEAADGVMVARGDLGVEIPFAQVPAAQKRLIKTTRIVGRKVITATEMLESMIKNPRPTRAEISDVANAVYDGSSAVMLSGETASGAHPVEAVRTMAEICEYTESQIDYAKNFLNLKYTMHDRLDSIAHAACSMSIDLNAKCIVVNSISGTTAKKISRFRSPADILGATTDASACRRLALNWGVTPILVEDVDSQEEMFRLDLEGAIDHMDLQPGDNIIATAGTIGCGAGNTDIIKLMTVTGDDVEFIKEIQKKREKKNS